MFGVCKSSERLSIIYTSNSSCVAELNGMCARFNYNFRFQTYVKLEQCKLNQKSVFYCSLRSYTKQNKETVRSKKVNYAGQMNGFYPSFNRFKLVDFADAIR